MAGWDEWLGGCDGWVSEMSGMVGWDGCLEVLT